MHNVDEDTSVEEAMIVCKHRLEVKADLEGKKMKTVTYYTSTGRPVPLVTITKSAGLSLPTIEADSSPFGAGVGPSVSVVGIGAAAVIGILHIPAL